MVTVNKCITDTFCDAAKHNPPTYAVLVIETDFNKRYYCMECVVAGMQEVYDTLDKIYEKITARVP